MDKERISQLIARNLSGEASPEEIKELEIHLQEHPEDAYFLSILDDYWVSPVSTIADESAGSEVHFRQILDAASDTEQEAEPLPETRTHYLRNILAVAAATTGLLAGAWLYFKPSDSKPEAAALTETVVKPGAKSRLLLPDGTVVWLNAGSRLSYPATFTDSAREVSLEGEAYFDVAKHAERPFIVHTRDLHIKVLGTVFNVKCYPDDHKTEATLISGLVQVRKTGDAQEKAFLLHPHDKVVVSQIQELETVAAPKDIMVKHLKQSIADTAIVETAWVYNKLVFDGEDFREIANEMERWYNVKISINDPAVAAYRFHARFEHETVIEVLKALQVSQPFTFKIINNEINIYK